LRPIFAGFVAPDPASGQALWGFATQRPQGLMIALMSPVLGRDCGCQRPPQAVDRGIWLPAGARVRPDVVRKARRSQCHSGPVAVVRKSRASAVEFRHRLQQRDDADAGTTRKKIGAAIPAPAGPPAMSAGILSLILVLGFLAANSRKPGRTLFGFMPLFRASTRWTTWRATASHRPADRDLVHPVRAADVFC